MYFKLLVFSVLILGISTTVLTSPKLISIERNGNSELNSTTNTGTLLMAHVIYRHGDRNIAKIFPNDPYKDEIHWPGGIGQLTKKGKMQAYKLGQFFRRRYANILGEKYSSKKIYVQSTDVDRTLCSAQANLAGLFPPTKDEMWHANISWLPIPVHTMPKEVDEVLLASKHCPKYEAAYKEYMKNSPEVQRIYTEYADLFSYISKMSGTNITTIAGAYWLHNTLVIEKEHNKTLSDSALSLIQPNEPLTYIATFDYKTYADTTVTARLKSGFLLKEILEHFSRKANYTLQPDRALWLYSGHDTTLLNMLNSLGLYEFHISPYASSLHFELYKIGKNQHYIQIFYRKSGEEILSPMKIPKCGEKCPLEQFYTIYNDIIPGNYDTECQITI